MSTIQDLLCTDRTTTYEELMSILCLDLQKRSGCVRDYALRVQARIGSHALEESNTTDAGKENKKWEFFELSLRMFEEKDSGGIRKENCNVQEV